ncbi:hypothetical protein GQ55_9G554900 [Panicum hallii var. hallii]|uniref:Uncharacterized protein n=1 Tax=Panicum hallii var. hallii TaxID=1504633 RepID=A0A2T7CFQ4_9POAL|nr:hypothetical protein GQ55_9G554900 [Panicum hallii var. hallii]
MVAPFTQAANPPPHPSLPPAVTGYCSASIVHTQVPSASSAIAIHTRLARCLCQHHSRLAPRRRQAAPALRGFPAPPVGPLAPPEHAGKRP